MRQVIADVIIPVASWHENTAQDAIGSAHAQTVPVNVIVQHDVDGHGAAQTRNEAVKAGSAPFIVFLDADDVLLADFVAKTLARWLEKRSGYVYTDWWRGVNIASAHEQNNIFSTGMYHIITTLLPRKAFEYVGGFDTTLPTLEDEDLYRRIQRAGLCAWRVPEPLVKYRAEHGQSATLRDRLLPDMEAWFNRRDGILKGKSMCNCTSNTPGGIPVADDTSIYGAYQEGDVLAMALYSPARRTSPTDRMRTYPAPMMGYPMWVSGADVLARPDMWQPVPAPEDINPAIDTVLKLAGVS